MTIFVHYNVYIIIYTLNRLSSCFQYDLYENDIYFFFFKSLVANYYPSCFSKQDIYPGKKYILKNEKDVYQLIILNPKVEDTGKYTINVAGISCTAYLNVDGKFFFENFNSKSFSYIYYHLLI